MKYNRQTENETRTDMNRHRQMGKTEVKYKYRQTYNRTNSVKQDQTDTNRHRKQT